PSSAVPPDTTKPGLVKTVGFFNLFVGGLLLLSGSGCLGGVLPFLFENDPFQIDPAVAREAVEEMRRGMIGELKERGGSSGTDAERSRIRKQRLELESKRFQIETQVDFRTVNDDLPWLSRYLWADLISGPVLNAFLLVSGVGLIRLKSWGWTWAV